jgi:hypothetical protein
MLEVWMVNNAKWENAGKNLSLYASLGTYTSSVVEVTIFVKKVPVILSTHVN